MNRPAGPLVTIAVPSLNQGRFLNEALTSIFEQGVPMEVFVADAGSTDESLQIIHKWSSQLAGWRSHKDAGQAAAINEAIALGTAPFVAWLNSDDLLVPGGLAQLLAELQRHPDAALAYGKVWNHDEATGVRRPNREVRPFQRWWMAQFNLVAQPGTLMRRKAWDAVGGLDPTLHLAMDYDLWWKLYRHAGTPRFVRTFVAVNRRHDETKTSMQRRRHYQEAMQVVKKHHGRIPLKWWVAQPIAVWLRSLLVRQRTGR